MLGLHIQRWGPGAADSVKHANGRVLKIMDPSIEPLHACLTSGTVLVCRRYFDDGQQRRRLTDRYYGGQETADDVYSTFYEVIRLARSFGCPVYIEGLNEIGLWDDADNYNAFTVGFADRCKENSVKPAVYSFATGNPPGYKDGSPDDLRAYWAHYLDGLYATQAAGGALALHEYDAPDMRRLETWLCLRYRRVYDILPADLKSLPLLITECGIDGGVLGAPSAAAAGWRNYATPEQYAEQLRWYDSEIAKDPYVLGATVFTAGNADMWGSFDVTGVEPVLDAIAAGTPHGGAMPKPTTITPLNRPYGTPGGTAVFEFKASGVDGTAKGFADVAYPPLPGNEFGAVYGPNMTTELPPFKNGSSTVTVNLPPNDHPLPAGGVQAELRLRILELDGKEFDGGIHGPFALDIVQGASQPQPAPQPPAVTVPPTAPSNPGSNWQNSPNLGLMTRFYEAAHALEGNADPKVSEIGRRAVGYLDNWKDGSDLPFEGKPKK